MELEVEGGETAADSVSQEHHITSVTYTSKLYFLSLHVDFDRFKSPRVELKRRKSLKSVAKLEN